MYIRMYSEIAVSGFLGVSDVYFDAQYIWVKLNARIWLENRSKTANFHVNLMSEFA